MYLLQQSVYFCRLEVEVIFNRISSNFAHSERENDFGGFEKYLTGQLRPFSS